MHEPIIHKCLFCGEAEDDLSHYLVCDLLWDMLISTAKLKSNHLSLSALERLGLVKPSALHFRLLACAFKVYHAFKLEYIDRVLHSLAAEDEAVRLHLTLELAKIYLEEEGLL